MSPGRRGALGFRSSGSARSALGCWGALLGAGQKAPGFAKGLELARHSFPVRINSYPGTRGEGLHRDDVPDIQRHDPGREHVNVVGRIAATFSADVGAGRAEEIRSAHVERGLDLHSPEAVAGVEDEVKRFVVAQRFGETEAEARGFVGKCKFSQFARALGERLRYRVSPPSLAASA